MKLAELSQLVLAIATLLGVVFSGLVSLRNGRKIKETHVAINETNVAMDGMKDQLVRSTDAAARAQGMADGRASQKEEDKR